MVGLDGRPMPRKAIKTQRESDDKFWDFARQFFFGLWGFRQRPYPPGRPIDVAQAIGYKKLERRYYDCKFMHMENFHVSYSVWIFSIVDVICIEFLYVLCEFIFVIMWCKGFFVFRFMDIHFNKS